MTSNNSTKTKWPELKNQNVKEAIEIIKKERPDLNVFKVIEGSKVTQDIRNNRVRVYYNKQTNKVTKQPVIM